MDVPGQLTTAARAWLESLETEQREQAHGHLEVSDRKEWTYLPGPRPGLSLAEMDEAQRTLALELLDAGLSERGAATAHAIMDLDDILREVERSAGVEAAERRDSCAYWFQVLGEPGRQTPWMLKVGGHHLNVHVTVVGDQIAGTPLFFGANPAVVPAGHQHAGLRTLPQEEDLARAFLRALTPSQRELAISELISPNDIRTRHDPVADVGRIPHGLEFHHLHGEHRDLLVSLIRHYLDRLVPEIADTAWGEIEAAGLERVTFRWAGSTEAKPGHAHYYAVLGPTFLLEYDNSQNNANHVHTVYRDLRHDWGEDLLAAHYINGHPH